MSVNTLESEDLENVPLVRMEDVQPSRDKSYELKRNRRISEESVEEVLGTCVIEGIVYDTEAEYIVNNDDDSNIGSMVSIKSEEVAEDDDAEMIVPEIVDKLPIHITFDKRQPESSWPTLEILPGGVIRKPEKSYMDLHQEAYDEDFEDGGEMMYACAKCPERFKFLFRLVKHVKMHEDETKRLQQVTEDVEVIAASPTKRSKLKTTSKQKQVATNKRKIMLGLKSTKKKSPKKLKS